MKKISIGIITLLLIGSASVWANSTGIFGAYWKTDDLNEGVGAGAKIKFDFSDYVALDLRGSWLTFDDVELDVIPLEASLHLTVPFGEALSPYAGVGAGYYIFDADKGEIENSVGAFAIGGLELHLREGVSLFGEIRYFLLEADVDKVLDKAKDLDKELNFDGYGINAGLLLRW